ncbi:hypothetical protein 1 [Beihai picorna-like virus 120]|uniref:hypothetical protein 1 n=1 Tax=Beihai picorna-like virus 120 TaxID=1922549 RepID=UPI000909D2F3|nr:hypothetical protein 1 [Beihai picorna-like virus 120]APG76873.1 hypothetical protein 1 [Beihai picorna-like virus 120]
MGNQTSLERCDDINTALTKVLELCQTLKPVALTQNLSLFVRADCASQRCVALAALCELYGVAWKPISEDWMQVLQVLAGRIVMRDIELPFGLQVVVDKLFPQSDEELLVSHANPLNILDAKTVGIVAVVMAIVVMIGGSTILSVCNSKKLSDFFRDAGNLGRTVTGLEATKNTCTHLAEKVLVDICGYELDDPVSRARKEFLDTVGEKVEILNCMSSSFKTDMSEFLHDPTVFKKTLQETHACTKRYQELSLKTPFPAGQAEINRLQKLQQTIVEQMESATTAAGIKQEPVVVWLYGESGIGKSFFADTLCEALRKYESRKVTKYTRSTTKHWDDYVGQLVVQFDDFGSSLDDEESLQLNQIYTDASYSVPMAAVEHKGRQFSSKYVVICSNFPHIGKSSVLADPTILLRRRDFLIECTDPQYKKDLNYSHRKDGWEPKLTRKNPIPQQNGKQGKDNSLLTGEYVDHTDPLPDAARLARAMFELQEKKEAVFFKKIGKTELDTRTSVKQMLERAEERDRFRRKNVNIDDFRDAEETGTKDVHYTEKDCGAQGHCMLKCIAYALAKPYWEVLSVLSSADESYQVIQDTIKIEPEFMTSWKRYLKDKQWNSVAADHIPRIAASILGCHIVVDQDYRHDVFGEKGDYIVIRKKGNHYVCLEPNIASHAPPIVTTSSKEFKTIVLKGAAGSGKTSFLTQIGFEVQNADYDIKEKYKVCLNDVTVSQERFNKAMELVFLQYDEPQCEVLAITANEPQFTNMLRSYHNQAVWRRLEEFEFIFRRKIPWMTSYTYKDMENLKDSGRAHSEIVWIKHEDKPVTFEFLQRKIQKAGEKVVVKFFHQALISGETTTDFRINLKFVNIGNTLKDKPGVDAIKDTIMRAKARDLVKASRLYPLLQKIDFKEMQMAETVEELVLSFNNLKVKCDVPVTILDYEDISLVLTTVDEVAMIYKLGESSFVFNDDTWYHKTEDGQMEQVSREMHVYLCAMKGYIASDSAAPPPGPHSYGLDIVSSVTACLINLGQILAVFGLTYCAAQTGKRTDLVTLTVPPKPTEPPEGGIIAESWADEALLDEEDYYDDDNVPEWAKPDQKQGGKMNNLRRGMWVYDDIRKRWVWIWLEAMHRRPIAYETNPKHETRLVDLEGKVDLLEQIARRIPNPPPLPSENQTMIRLWERGVTSGPIRIEHKPRKFVPDKSSPPQEKIFQKDMFEGPELTSEACADANLLNIVQSVTGNIVDLGLCKGLLLSGDIGVTVAHPFEMGEEFNVEWKGQNMPAKVIKRMTKKDVCFFQKKGGNKARNIITHLPKRGAAPLMSQIEALLQIYRPQKDKTPYYFFHHMRVRTTKTMAVSGLDHEVEGVTYEPKSSGFQCQDMLTQVGDCGSIVYAVRANEYGRIMGIHCAGNTGIGFFARVMQEDIPEPQPEKDLLSHMLVFDEPDFKCTMFQGKQDEFSNMFPVQVHYDIDGEYRTDRTFSSSEHAYQYTKCIKHDKFRQAQQIMQNPDPFFAKRTARFEGSEEWESEKRHILKDIARKKFEQNEFLKQMLTESVGPIYECVAGNYFWSTGMNKNQLHAALRQGHTYPGENQMGRILEELRDEFQDVRSTKVKKDYHIAVRDHLLMHSVREVGNFDVVGIPLKDVTSHDPFCNVQPGKTQFARSPFWMKGVHTHMYQPSVLHHKDARCDNQNPLMLSMEKFLVDTTWNPDLELMSAICMSIADEIEYYLKTYNVPLRPLTVTEVINRLSCLRTSNPLVRQTSSGWPFCKLPGIKGKDLLFKEVFQNSGSHFCPTADGQRAVAHMNGWENSMALGHDVPCVFMASLKDEIVKLKNIEICKTRTFLGAPVQYSMLYRRWLHAIDAGIALVREEIPVKIGINPSSTEWNSLFEYLTEYGDVGFMADYSRFDRRVDPSMFQYMAEIYLQIMMEFPKIDTPEHDREYRRNVVNGLMRCLQSPLVMVGNKIVRLPRGNPSGQPGTAVHNSIFNWAYTVYAWTRICQISKAPLNWHGLSGFKNYVKLAVYGDDMVCCVHPDAQQIFSYKTFRKIIEEELGQTLTTSEKIARDGFDVLENMDFLKRHFVKKDAYVQGPLKREVFEKMLAWDRTPKRRKHDPEGPIDFDPTTIAGTARVAMLEASLVEDQTYAKECGLSTCESDFFERLKQHLNTRCARHGIPYVCNERKKDVYQNTYFGGN